MVTLRLAPGIPDLHALGAERPEDWLGDGSALVTGDRIELLDERPGRVVARVPLPGTPDADGVQRESPRGAGTGPLILRIWRGGGSELVRARLTEPRSASLAARRWNLACHLVANGVGAPDLVAMGEGSAGESWLLERELVGFESLSELARRPPGSRRRGLVVRSTGLALGALFRSGVWLPELSPEGLLVQRDPLDGSHVGSDTCAAIEVQDLQAAQGLARCLGLRRGRLPGVAFTELGRGRVVPAVSVRRRRSLLTSLESRLAGTLGPRECARVLALAAR